MERRNWSLKALKELIYVDSLNEEKKADALLAWFDLYLKENKIQDFDLETEDLKKLSELFYKNINFLKKHKDSMNTDMKNHSKIKAFLM